MGTHERRVPVGTQGYYPKKYTGMGWVGFVSGFHGYFRVGYPKRLLILGTFGYQIKSGVSCFTNETRTPLNPMTNTKGPRVENNI